MLSARLERTIATAGGCTEPWLDAGLRPLLTRPGKRLRPALLFASTACGPTHDHASAVSCATSLELMHLSSLIHDDLMDESDSRSGLPTLHTSIGPAAAIVGGDYLLAVGGRLAAEVSAEAAIVWQQTYADLCVGQARETANRYRLDTTMAEYLDAIRGKTAALMRAACRLGAVCGGVSGERLALFTQFGEAFGMVFQLVDDLMDVFSSDELWAKPVRQDVQNGVYTACVLAALDDPTGDPGGEMFSLLSPSMTRSDVDRAYAQAREFGAVAVNLIETYVRQAESALGALPASTALAELAGLPRRYATSAIESTTDPRFERLLGFGERRQAPILPAPRSR